MNSSRPSSAQWMSSNTSTSGPARRDQLQEPAPGRERLGAAVAAQLACGGEPGQRRQVRLDPARLVRVGDNVLDGDAELLLDVGRRVGGEDAGVGLHDLAQRPEGDAVAVGQRAALPPEHDVGLPLQVPEQLPDLARLADPGRPHQRHDLRLAAGHGAAERVDQHLRLVRAADQRALQAGRVGAGARTRLHHRPHRHRLGLALRQQQRLLPEVDLEAGRPVGALVHQDAVGRRARLQPRRGVDDVAVGGGIALLRPRVHVHHRLAGGDPDPHPQRAGGARRPAAAAPPAARRSRPAPPAPRRPRGRPARRTAPSPRRR